MSAHVVPKPKPFSASDEDEKTTLEAQWEDEASTTAEQGEVADKLRAFGLDPRKTPVPFSSTASVTGSTSMDEPTVDDQHANPALLALGDPLPNTARLSITAGNDAGRDVEILPGKTYTIGRGLDNDIVLTDIAVSRKHFDLRNDDGSWVIVDRGSGNGTVVNGNIEDNPFMLANGDSIEIGNTVFRFEQPEAPRRPSSLDVELDDEEMSTIAGKPLRRELVDIVPPGLPTPPFERDRPRTVPPDAPPLRGATAPPGARGAGSSSMRSQSPSSQPAMNRTQSPSNQPASYPSSGPSANRPPIAPPQAPTLLGVDPMQPIQGLQPTTLPGQGMAPRPLYYPQATDMPPQSANAQMLVISAHHGRNDGSTALVSPAVYNSMAQHARYSAPQISKRAKMIVGGAGLFVLAAVMTIAIIKSGSAHKAGDAGVGSGSGKDVAGPITKPTVDPIKVDPPKAIAKTDPPKTVVDPPKADLPKTVVDPPSITPKAIAKTDPPKTVVDPPSITPKADPPKTIAKTDPPKADPPSITPKADPPKTIAKTDPPTITTKADPPKTVAKIDQPTITTKADPPKTVAKADPPKADPPSITPKADPKPDKPDRTAARPPKTDKPDRTATPKRVATADNDTKVADAKRKADDLYHAKKFNDASNVLATQAKSLDEADAKPLRHTADLYVLVGRALTAASAPASRATDVYESLQKAQNYDRAVGGGLDSEIQTKIADVAPRAALAYMATKDFEKAHGAVLQAENLGTANGNVKTVKQVLEGKAGELYAAASQEISSNPDSAKEKLRRIKGMVDAKSPWYAKADKLLKGSS